MADVLKAEKNIRYELSGVDCPTCAIGIEQALHGKDGLETAVVDFAGGAIRFNPVYEETVISVLKDVEPNARIKASSAAEVLPDADTSTINRIFSFIPLRLLSSLVLFALGLTALSLELGTPWPEWILFAANYSPDLPLEGEYKIGTLTVEGISPGTSELGFGDNSSIFDDHGSETEVSWVGGEVSVDVVEGMCGDVNVDGKVTNADAMKVWNRAINENYPLNCCQ